MQRIIKASADVRGPALLALALLAGCGGGGGDSELAPGATSFRAYAASAGGDTATPAALTAAEKEEVARLSREWAVATLVPPGGGVGSNEVVIPSLHFARAQAVAAAAAGDTLAQLRLSVPAASPGVQAALMRGLTRTISAGPDAAVTESFMRSVTAAGQVAPWAALTLDQLSAATQAGEPRLRLRIRDEFRPSVPWPQVVAFDGVFINAGGVRLQVPMLRVSGQLRRSTSANMTAMALALPQGRWLVRITPTGPMAQWSAAELQAALAGATADVLGTGGATSGGELVLPAATDFTALGMDDQRGLTLAQDRVQADLRGLDGRGGTYAELSVGHAGLSLGAAGLTCHGSTTASFVYSPFNNLALDSYGASGRWVNWSSSGWFVTGSSPVPCGDINLQPAYLALVNELGGLEMLARFTTLQGPVCE